MKMMVTITIQFEISTLKLNDNLARSVLGSGLSVGTAENTTATNDGTGLVAVSLAKSQASGSGSGSTCDNLLLSRNIRVGRGVGGLAGGGSA